MNIANHQSCDKINDVIVLIPIYKEYLSEIEFISMRQSLQILNRRHMSFIAPEGLNTNFYHKYFPCCSITNFPSHHFRSTEDYSRLLVHRDFYQYFKRYSFLLILQSDAIVFRDDLDYWMNQPYDYIGAPWHSHFEFNVNLDIFSGDNNRIARINVGNGGLSLRRVDKCINLIAEFPECNQYFIHSGSNEDFFFALLGSLSSDFIIPNEIIASRFSMEHRPDYYFKTNGGHLPMGAHGWHSIAKDFWIAKYPELNDLLTGATT
jgi:hypothetical protein